MASFDVLDRKGSVHGGLFLEASAGTGKTFAIEHLVLRLLLEGKDPLRIDQILVVTFTRAATRELKMRMRSNLEKALRYVQRKKSEWDYLNAIIEGGEEAAFVAEKRIVEALAYFDEAPIYTLHGFCYHVLKEHAFEAHAPFEINEPESQKHLQEMRTMLFDTLRTELAPPAFSSHQVAHLLRKAKGDPQKLTDDLLALLEKDKEISKGKTFREHCEQIEAVLQQFSISSKCLREDYKALAPCYKLMTNPAFLKQVEVLSALLEKKVVEPESLDQLIKDKECFLEKLTLENQKVRAKLPADGELNYPGVFDQLRKEILPIIQEAKDPKHLLLRLASSAKKKQEIFFSTHDHLPPDELLKKTREALQDPHFLSLIQERFRALVMDEFQDTDPIQWEIVQLLWSNTGRKQLPEKKSLEKSSESGDTRSPMLYLVGDPKQSIYGFRKADVYTFLKAGSMFPEPRRSFLTTNYRSDPPLVLALNSLFSYSKEWMHLPATEETLPYQELLVSPEKKEEKRGEGSIHFFLFVGKQGRKGSWPTKSIETDVLFPFIAKEVARLQVPMEEIAVLVKDRFQAERMHSYFKKVGIPSALRKKERAADALALFPLIQVLGAALNPDDSSFVKRALGTPLFGWTADDLQEEERVQKMKAHFLSLYDVWQAKGIGALYQRLKSYPSLQELMILLIEKEKENALQPFELYDFLKKIKKQKEEVFLPSSCASNRVQIMTLHMSKGLEFSIVFALGLATRHAHLDEFVATKEALTVRLDDAVGNAALFETDEEKLRQLYVGLTRAKRRVYIPLLLDDEGKEVKKGTASPLELFLSRISNTTLPLSKSSVYSLLSKLDVRVEEIKEETPQSFDLAQEATPLSISSPTVVFSEERIFSFSALAKKHKSTFPEQEESMSPHGLPLGAATGIVLHHIFEQIFLYELYAPFDRRRIQEVIKTRVVSTPLCGWEEIIFKMIEETLHLPLPGKRKSFRLVDLKADEVLQEMEFVYPTEGGLLKGFIDLAVSHDGYYYLIDWKSNFLGNDDSAYSQEKIERAMKENDYFLQASLYAEALKRYLKPFDPRPFEELFGGAFYIFLRGKRVVNSTLQLL